jgi:hypothetical protein
MVYRHQLRVAALLAAIVLLVAACSAPKTPGVIEQDNPAARIAAALDAADVSQEEKQGVPVYTGNLTYDGATHQISGSYQIKATNNEGVPLDKVYFHLYQNAFRRGASVLPYEPQDYSGVYPNGFSEGYIDTNNVKLNGKPVTNSVNETILEVKPENPIKPGETYTIDMDMVVQIANAYHRTGYNDKGVWLGNCLPILAVYDDEGWNLDPYYAIGDPFYSDMSNYRITWTLPASYGFATTGARSVKKNGDAQIIEVKADLVRDYAAAFGPEYKENDLTTADGHVVRLLTYSKGIDPDRILRTSAESLDYFSKRIGPYPYPELNVIEVPMVWGGMEYPNLEQISDILLQTGRWTEPVVHEIGHNWFYNIIGNDEVDEAWLDEGFTEYITAEFLADNDLGALGHRLNGYRSYTEAASRERPEEVILLPVTAYRSMNTYAIQVYYKAAVMIYELRKGIGEENFSKFVNEYYSQYRFKNATTADFERVAEEASGRDLDSFFNAWLTTGAMPALAGN